MTTIHPTAAGQSASPDLPATRAVASESFAEQLSQAQVDQTSSESAPAQELDPSAPPMPPPPPPPPSIPDAQAPALLDADAPAASPPAGSVQPVGEPPGGESPFEGVGASTAAAPTGGQALLASLGLPPALQRIIREARRFVPGNATLHIFSTAPGAFRGRFVVPQQGVLNSAPPAPATVVAPPRTVPGPDPADPSPTPDGNLPQPPAPPSAPAAPDGSSLAPPPPPPPIPPDEIILPDETNPDSEAETGAAPAAQIVTSAVNAYRAAAEAEVNPLAVGGVATARDE